MTTRKIIFFSGIVIYILLFITLPHFYIVRFISHFWNDSLFILKEYIHRTEPSKDVLVVAIDEPSFKEIGLRWPWPRSLHAKLIESLEQHGAKVIAFDILFSEPSSDPKEDEVLSHTIKKYNNIVLGFAYSLINRENFVEQMEVPPIAKLAKSCDIIGLLNFYPDEDGIIRHGRIVVNENYTLAAGAVAKFLNNKKELVSKEYPDPFIIQFGGSGGGIKTVSYYQALRPEKYLPRDIFKNKIVFIGFASEAAVEVERGAVDAFPTPYFRITRKLMYGVKIHANAAQTLIKGCPLREITSQNIYTFSVFLLLSLGGFMFRKKAIWVVSYPIAGIVGTISLSLIMFDMNMIYIPSHAVLGFLCSHIFWSISEYALSAKEKMFLRKAFSLYVSKEVVNEIVNKPDLLRLGGERKKITILFSDIRDFTSFSEKTSPETLVKLLNEYLSSMTKEVFMYGGTLDKYIGDAIMALFGAPIYYPDHATRACKTAIGMIKKMNSIAFKWEEHGLSNFAIGIGINTGEVIVGNLGSEQRFDYTAVGDHVNLASRLEGLSKIYKVPIIISETTVYEVKEDLLFRELDTVRVKGKTEPIKIFTLCPPEEYSRDLVSMYLETLTLYRKGDFKNAILKCEKILNIYPYDGPTKLIMDRSRLLLKDPPTKWTGIWDIKTK